MKMKNEPFFIRELLEETTALFEHTKKMKELEIKVKCHESVPQLITTDKKKYQLVLINLFDNAIKYTIKGVIIIDITFLIDTIHTNSNYLQTQITDTGCGISPEKQARLYKLFSKSDTEAAHLNPQGSGMGLYLAKQLSQKLGGDIKITSSPNIGTTAIFTIKIFNTSSDQSIERSLAEEEKASLMPSERQSISIVPSSAIRSVRSVLLEDNCTSSVQSSPVKKKESNFLQEMNLKCNCTKVLLVDDEELNLLVLRSILQTEKIPCDCARNGEDAMNMVMNRHNNQCCGTYRIILMDINMPVMDGIEATRRIKEMESEKFGNRKIYVVAVTAASCLDDTDIYSQYIHEGFEEILEKPVSKKDILERMVKYGIL